MKKIFIPLAASALLLSFASCTSCSDEKKDNHDATEAKGGIYTGGMMRMNEVEAFKSLNPIAVNDVPSFHIGSQLFEGLVKFNQNDLSLQPAIASRWDINENQTEWTFHLRPNVMFHPDPCFANGKGRALTANDVKFCFDKLCTSDPNNAQFDVTFKNRVAGADEAFNASKTGKSPGVSVNDVPSFHIGSQLFEGLVKFNQNDLSLQPAIASRWDINENQTEWTFHLRPNVMFHPDPCFANGKGRALTANDVKFCFDKLCTSDPNNAQFDVTFKNRVAGADEAFNASKTGKSPGVAGIKATNDSTLVITLKSPFAGFLNVLAMPGCWIYPKEASDKYGIDLRIHAVGTGPFLLETVKEGEVLIMKKNPDYYGVDKDGNKLPYLDGVKISFIREKKAEILEFKSGNLDMVYRLPVEIFHEIMGDLENAKERKTDFQIINSPALNSNCIGFNCTAAAFNKKEVRLAFNYAIDRHKIADFTIQGEGTSADYGIVPYVKSFEDAGYNFKGIKGYTFDAAKAKDYLKQAGYPDGKGFPKVTLQINSGGGDRNILVAEVIQKMLKENLNIDVDINTTPLSEHIESMISGKSDMFRFSWVADYPEPETFLTLFYGKHVPANPSEKSFINYFRFKNEKFDALFEESFKESDKAKRFAILSQAEQIVLDEAPFMPIFYDENFRLEQLNVRNFPENAMTYMDLSVVYLIPKDKMPKK